MLDTTAPPDLTTDGPASSTEPEPAIEPASRRDVLRRSFLAAAAAAVGGVFARGLGGGSPARATNGQPIIQGQANIGTANTVVQNSQTGGIGIFGQATAPSGAASTGVRGQSDTPNGNGVIGAAHSGAGALGVWGAANQGTGVRGSGVTGVSGSSNATGGKGVYGGGDYGVYGEGTLSNSWGVFGLGSVGVVAFGGGTGLVAQGQFTGVSGSSLDLNGGNSRGVYGNGFDYGVYGEGRKSQSYGVYGKAPYGVVGDATITGVVGKGPTGVAGIGSAQDQSGVYGRSDGYRGNGVFGQALGTGGTGVTAEGALTGVYAHGGNAGLVGHGFYGAYATGTNFGVYGSSAMVGVQGFGSPGVRGEAFGSGARAGLFVGPVHITGALTKGGGAFLIDHPLDPANRYLAHSFVESPDMKNVYDGSVILDARGRATVRLPSYYHALNSDHRVQLTAVGAPAPDLHVAQEVADFRFRIAGGRPGQKVFWQVTGIRQDAWARQNRIKVDYAKPAADRGKYAHPEVHAKRKKDGIDYLKPSRSPLVGLKRPLEPGVPAPRRHVKAPQVPTAPGRTGTKG